MFLGSMWCITYSEVEKHAEKFQESLTFVLTLSQPCCCMKQRTLSADEVVQGSTKGIASPRELSNAVQGLQRCNC
jgi:hypothetical protein